MIAISCCTPYHIINAINLKLNLYSSEKVDLFICSHFQNAEIVYKKALKSDLFNNVYLIDDEKLTVNEVNRIKLFHNYNILGIDVSKLKYDIFYFSAYTNFNINIARYLKLKQKTRIIFVEDGLQTYIENYSFRSNSKLKNIFKYLIKDFNLDYIDECKVYDKRLMQGDYYKNVSDLPCINNNEKVREVVNYIFDFEKYDISKYKYIFLDQKSADKEQFDKWKEIYCYFKQITKDNEIIIKMHPREDVNKYENAILYENYSVPMELLFLNAKNESIFITMYSTAAFSNSVIFKRKTTVILLYKMFNIYNESIEKYIDSVKKNYDVDIYIPKNKEELGTIIEKLNLNN